MKTVTEKSWQEKPAEPMMNTAEQVNKLTKKASYWVDGEDYTEQLSINSLQVICLEQRGPCRASPNWAEVKPQM